MKKLTVFLSLVLLVGLEAQANCDQAGAHAQSSEDSVALNAAAADKKASKTASAKAAAPADAEIIVKGMTCEACAVSIKQQFRTDAAVDKADVDVKAATVRVYLKPGQAITEERIRELIKPTGFTVENVKLKAKGA